MKLIVFYIVFLNYIQLGCTYKTSFSFLTNISSQPQYPDSVCMEDMEVWYGSIQGGNNSGLYILGQCFNESRSFDLMCVPKTKYDNTLSVFQKNKKNMEHYFECYSFSVNLSKNKKPEDEFDLYRYVFPQTIITFKLNDGNWKMIENKVINSVKEFSNYKIELAKSLNK